MKEFKKESMLSIKFLLIAIIIVSLIFLGLRNIVEKDSDILNFLMFLIVAILIVLVVYLVPVIFIKLGKYIGNFIKKRSQLDKTDFEKNKKYYREILEINSPLIVGYLDDLDLNKNKLIAELLYMKRKGVLDIKNDGIEIVDNYDVIELKKSELAILQKISKGKLIFDCVEDFLLEEKKLVSEESKNLQFVTKKESKSKARSILLIIFSLLVAFAFYIFIEILTQSIVAKKLIFDITFDYFVPIMILLLLFSPLLGIFVFCEYDKYRGDTYKRTSKGQEINRKLEGLKNYLKDYSMMDEREAKEIELWEDYLIYSVMFGHNKKIIEEYEKYIEIIE